MDRDSVWLGCPVTEAVMSGGCTPTYWVVTVPRVVTPAGPVVWQLDRADRTYLQPTRVSWVAIQHAAELVRSGRVAVAAAVACDRGLPDRERKGMGDLPTSNVVGLFARAEWVPDRAQELVVPGRAQLGMLIDDVYNPRFVGAGQGGQDGT